MPGYDPIAARVVEHLDALGARYEMIPCDPEFADTAAFCEHYGYPLDRSANAILVASRKPEGQLAMCLVLAGDRLDVNGTVRRKLGVRKLSFAPQELTADVTKMEIGGVTVFALPDGVPLWVDAGVMAKERIIVGGGSRSWKVELSPTVFETMEGTEIVTGLAMARPDPEAADTGGTTS